MRKDGKMILWIQIQSLSVDTPCMNDNCNSKAATLDDGFGHIIHLDEVASSKPQCPSHLCDQMRIWASMNKKS